ncbi:MIP/aquaporin family protein [Rudaea sp.]|uniref:MIP/aquaporin family protein n=1 Tax=Rudaea sp. TaxID=2136325 RepID=UPI002ED63646
MTRCPALVAELAGTAALLAIEVGSGIMGERLAMGNAAVALLANSLSTGAGLFVLISTLAPISGAHFNPAVSCLFCWRGELSKGDLAAYVAVQIMGAVLGVWLAHAMFDLPILQAGAKVRTGTGQWTSEAVATIGLLATILLGLRTNTKSVPALVACYITAAYWFTASTSFANPAVTMARSLTDTFAGIRWPDVPGFIAAQAAATSFVMATLKRNSAATASSKEDECPTTGSLS